MRYIRTEDGRVIDTKTDWNFKDGWFKVKGNTLIETNWEETVYEGEYVESKTTVDKIKIIKQADTIKDVCDEGVCNNSLTGFVNIYGFELYKKYKCYGAIWTNKGLIYVAKINNKGELELI